MGNPALNRVAVFLDRDGVLNHTRLDLSGVARPPWSLDEFELLPGVPEACAALRALGCLLVVVTNQPDVARGGLGRMVLDSINDELSRRLPLDSIRVCCHDDADQCDCRKPAPGMLLQAAAEMGIDLRRSFIVGDRWRDIGAGQRAGCQTVLVGTNPVEPGFVPVYHAESLLEAVDWIGTRLADRQSSPDRVEGSGND